jgi:sugar transferase (PEP-CTERM system associated)
MKALNWLGRLFMFERDNHMDGSTVKTSARNGVSLKSTNLTPDSRNMIETTHFNLTPLSTDHEAGVLGEESFHGMLRLESKRQDRSQKIFLLMLIDANTIESASERLEILRKIWSIRISALRETDIMGWYVKGCTLGIIFTEIGDAGLEQAKESILSKTREHLRHILLPRDLERLSLSVHQPGAERPRPSQGNQLDAAPHIGRQEECTESEYASTPPVWGVFVRQRWFLFLGDVLLMTMASLLATWIRLGAGVDLIADYTGALAISLMLAPMSLYVFDMYNVEKRFGLTQTFIRTTLAFLFVAAACSSLFYLIPQWQYGRGVFITEIGFSVLLLVGWRVIYNRVLPANTLKTSALVVGAGAAGMSVYRLLCASHSPYEVKGFLDDDLSMQGKVMNSPAVVGTVDQLKEKVHELGIQTVVLAIPRNRPSWTVRRILETRLQGVETLEIPEVYERLTGRVPVEYIEDRWLLFSDGFYLLSKQYMQKLKRLIDFAIAGVALLLTSPFMALTAIMIRLDSPGPVLYTQQRVGKGSKVFTLCKFRSMQVNAESNHAVWAQKRDPRVTRVGKWIRLFRIDELPQLWNVFMGDMSLVGPRPERPEFVRELETKIPYYNVRHTVQPGITGWAQVKYPYGASIEDALRKLEYDLFYIKNMSIVFDMKIMLRTLGVVILGEGAR